MDTLGWNQVSTFRQLKQWGQRATLSACVWVTQRAANSDLVPALQNRSASALISNFIPSSFKLSNISSWLKATTAALQSTKPCLLSDPLWPSCSSLCSHFPLTSFATCRFCSDAWSPYHNHCHWLMPWGRRNSTYFRWNYKSPGGDMVRADVGVCWWVSSWQLQQIHGAGTLAWAHCSRLPWEDVTVFVTLSPCLESFHSKARPKDCPETSSPADIFLLHQFSNWPLLDFSRLSDYIQCRSTNELYRKWK